MTTLDEALQIDLAQFDKGSGVSCSLNTLSNNVWHDVVITHKDGVKKVYLDGKRHLTEVELDAIDNLKVFDLLTPSNVFMNYQRDTNYV